MNPVALITGASRGIGRGIALELAKTGHDLLINYARNTEAAETTVRQCEVAAKSAGHNIRVVAHKADISKREERDDLFGFSGAAFGHIDLLVNNAGVAPDLRADLLEASEESFDRLIDTNLKGPYFLTQNIAKWMIEDRKWLLKENIPHPPEKIIFVSSVSAYTASVNRGDYCVSKAGVSMICKLFAARLAEHGIGVFEIRPGIIATDMTGPVKEKYDQLIANGLTPIKRWGTPEDIGRAVAAVASGAFPFSTGEVINVDGGFHLRRL